MRLTIAMVDLRNQQARDARVDHFHSLFAVTLNRRTSNALAAMFAVLLTHLPDFGRYASGQDGLVYILLGWAGGQILKINVPFEVRKVR